MGEVGNQYAIQCFLCGIHPLDNDGIPLVTQFALQPPTWTIKIMELVE